MWFDLEVDNDSDPMDVVTSGNCDVNGREYLGPELKGQQRYRAKLVGLGYVRNLEEARKRADELGYRCVEGQAREPFKAKFPKPDGKGVITFGTSEWKNPSGNPSVACLSDFEGEWYPYFHESGDCFYGNRRWLVVEK